MASPQMLGDVYFEKELTEQTLGLRFNGVEVTSLIPGRWAEKNGIEVDDEIFEVAGKAFAGLTRDERLKAIVEAPRPLRMKFKRPKAKDTYYEITLKERKIGMTMKGKYVKTVEGGGWADRNGVQVGDEIAELAGKGYAELTDEEKLKTFAGPRPINMKLVRRLATQPKTDSDQVERKTWAPDHAEQRVLASMDRGESVSVRERATTFGRQYAMVLDHTNAKAQSRQIPTVLENSRKTHMAAPDLQEHEILAAAMRTSQLRTEHQTREEVRHEEEAQKLRGGWFFSCCDSGVDRVRSEIRL